MLRATRADAAAPLDRFRFEANQIEGNVVAGGSAGAELPGVRRGEVPAVRDQLPLPADQSRPLVPRDVGPRWLRQRWMATGTTGPVPRYPSDSRLAFSRARCATAGRYLQLKRRRRQAVDWSSMTLAKINAKTGMSPATAAIAVGLMVGLVAGTARAQTVVIGGPGGIRVQARVQRGPNGRPRVSVSLPDRPSTRRAPTPSPSRPPSRPRGGTTTRPAPDPTPPPSAQIPADADRACLASLRDWQVPFVPAGPTPGIRTPIQITGPIRGVRLIARGKPALMDCQLGHALARAAPQMLELGVTGLSFSGTYQYRNVRGTQRLSGHAHGLAIDVHALQTGQGLLDVQRDYPKEPGRWGAAGRSRNDVDTCVGDPPAASGRLLRTLACQLRSDPVFALVMGPDDNYDHRNHLHLEAHIDGPRELLSGTRSRHYYQSQRGRGQRR